MSAVLDRQDADTTEALEMRALERMLAAQCRHVELLMREAFSRDDLPSRENDLQLQAFTERRTQALKLLKTATTEPKAIRIARLEQLVEAIDCSRSYFLTARSGI